MLWQNPVCHISMTGLAEVCRGECHPTGREGGRERGREGGREGEREEGRWKEGEREGCRQKDTGKLL